MFGKWQCQVDFAELRACVYSSINYWLRGICNNFVNGSSPGPVNLFPTFTSPPTLTCLCGCRKLNIAHCTSTYIFSHRICDAVRGWGWSGCAGAGRWWSRTWRHRRPSTASTAPGATASKWKLTSSILIQLNNLKSFKIYLIRNLNQKFQCWWNFNHS